MPLALLLLVTSLGRAICPASTLLSLDLQLASVSGLRSACISLARAPAACCCSCCSCCCALLASMSCMQPARLDVRRNPTRRLLVSIGVASVCLSATRLPPVLQPHQLHPGRSPDHLRAIGWTSSCLANRDVAASAWFATSQSMSWYFGVAGEAAWIPGGSISLVAPAVPSGGVTLTVSHTSLHDGQQGQFEVMMSCAACCVRHRLRQTLRWT